MKTYLIRVNTVDNLYSDYMIEANNLFTAKSKCKKAFFRDFPNADTRIKLSLKNVDFKIINEIIDIIKKEGN